MSPTMRPVECVRDGRAATLTLRRPPLNILDLEVLGALGDDLDALASDPSLAVVIVRGAGEAAFSAGASVQDHAPERLAAMLAAMHRVVRALRGLPAIAVAAVGGHCLGGGMEIAMACDMVIATAGSRFGQPEVKLGCFAPAAAALYPSRLGPGCALELLALGEPIGAERAHALGLVQRLLPDGGLDEGCARLAAQLAALSTPVLRLIKRATAAGRDLPFAAALAETERLYRDDLAQLDDMREGIAAFLEKRQPAWSHR